MSCTCFVLVEGERVMEFTAAVGQKFATQMYDSCKDVGMPLIGTKIIGLFCGTSAEVCNIRVHEISHFNPPLYVSYGLRDGLIMI